MLRTCGGVGRRAKSLVEPAADGGDASADVSAEGPSTRKHEVVADGGGGRRAQALPGELRCGWREGGAAGFAETDLVMVENVSEFPYCIDCWTD